MSISSKVIMPVAALTLAGGLALTAHVASAQGFTQGHDDLVQRMAQHFGLNEDDVQEVFEEFHQERQAEHQAAFEQRLDEAIANGELTEEQKQLILAKHQEMKSKMEENRESFRDLSQEERRSQMEEQHEAMEAWAEENGIELGFFGKAGGRKDGGRHGGMRRLSGS